MQKKEDFNIFWEIMADRKFCPKIECIDNRDEMINLVDWEHLSDAADMNNNGEAALVIGYYKKRDNGSETKFFTRVLTVDTKTNQQVLLQKHPEERYDLVLLYSDVDEDGNPLEDEADKILGCIKVEGPIAETLVNRDGSPKVNRLLGEIMKDIALPIDGKVRIFEMHIPEKKKKAAKKSTRKRVAASAD